MRGIVPWFSNLTKLHNFAKNRTYVMPSKQIVQTHAKRAVVHRIEEHLCQKTRGEGNKITCPNPLEMISENVDPIIFIIIFFELNLPLGTLKTSPSHLSLYPSWLDLLILMVSPRKVEQPQTIYYNSPKYRCLCYHRTPSKFHRHSFIYSTRRLHVVLHPREGTARSLELI